MQSFKYIRDNGKDSSNSNNNNDYTSSNGWYENRFVREESSLDGLMSKNIQYDNSTNCLYIWLVSLWEELG